MAVTLGQMTQLLYPWDLKCPRPAKHSEMLLLGTPTRSKISIMEN